MGPQTQGLQCAFPIDWCCLVANSGSPDLSFIQICMQRNKDRKWKTHVWIFTLTANFFCVHEANYHKKTSEKVTRNVIICSADISLIHTRRSYDFDLQLAARSEVKFSCRTGTRYLYESGCPITPGLRSKPSSWRTVSVFFIRWRSLSYSTIDSKQDAETAFLISLYSDYLQKLNFTPKEAEFLPKQAVTLIGIPPWLLERQ